MGVSHVGLIKVDVARILSESEIRCQNNLNYLELQ